MKSTKQPVNKADMDRAENCILRSTVCLLLRKNINKNFDF